MPTLPGGALPPDQGMVPPGLHCLDIGEKGKVVNIYDGDSSRFEKHGSGGCSPSAAPVKPHRS